MAEQSTKMEGFGGLGVARDERYVIEVAASGSNKRST
jgi:hypothetical protein